VDLGQAAYLDVLAVRAGGRIAESRRFGQMLGRLGELAGRVNLSIGYLPGRLRSWWSRSYFGAAVLSRELVAYVVFQGPLAFRPALGRRYLSSDGLLA